MDQAGITHLQPEGLMFYWLRGLEPNVLLSGQLQGRCSIS